ncbi:MAG: cupredoxin domain-containing protein [Vicinamibacterales bacterium]
MRRTTNSNLWCAAALAIGLSGVLACGDNGGNGGPTGPSGGGSPGPSGATITIGANGAVSPAQVTINVGQSVTFVNSHSGSHQISSDPHPTHTNCPSINALGTQANGQTRLTNAFTAAGTCGFHDHIEPTNASLQGTITIR